MSKTLTVQELDELRHIWSNVIHDTNYGYNYNNHIYDYHCIKFRYYHHRYISLKYLLTKF